MASQLRLAVLAASDQLFGLELEHLAVDSCTTEAPCGGQTVGPSPVDRHKQGLKRSVAVERLRWLPCRPAQPTTATMGCWRRPWTPWSWSGRCHPAGGAPGRRLRRPPCRPVLAERAMVGQIATRGIPAPILVGRRWLIERTQCLGQPVRQATLAHRAAQDRGGVLAGAAIICGRLLRRAWTQYRWEGRPPPMPAYGRSLQASANRQS